MLQVGDQAPDFEGVIQSGKTIRLRDYAGGKLALYFYPRDNTPGCTKQACNLRDNLDELRATGFSVVGVSTDSIKSHGRFAAKYQLTFPLIADTDKVICEAYGVWGEKKMFGRTYCGIKRTTFLIDEKGEIISVIGRPKVSTHSQEILAAVAQ